MAPASPPSSLKQQRRAQGLRLADVAQDAGCSISLVSMVESGYMAGTPARASIAAAVGASLGSFWP